MRPLDLPRLMRLARAALDWRLVRRAVREELERPGPPRLAKRPGPNTGLPRSSHEPGFFSRLLAVLGLLRTASGRDAVDAKPPESPPIPPNEEGQGRVLKATDGGGTAPEAARAPIVETQG